MVSPKCYYFQRYHDGCFVFVFSRVSDVFPDVCGRLRGERILKTSLRGTYCGFCKQLPVSTVPSKVSRTSRNHRGLQPIITEGCPMIGWRCSIGCLSMHSSVDSGLAICTGRAAPNSSVRCADTITFFDWICLHDRHSS